jgi:hypothetical protein
MRTVSEGGQTVLKLYGTFVGAATIVSKRIVSVVMRKVSVRGGKRSAHSAVQFVGFGALQAAKNTAAKSNIFFISLKFSTKVPPQYKPV